MILVTGADLASRLGRFSGQRLPVIPATKPAATVADAKNDISLRGLKIVYFDDDTYAGPINNYYFDDKKRAQVTFIEKDPNQIASNLSEQEIVIIGADSESINHDLLAQIRERDAEIPIILYRKFPLKPREIEELEENKVYYVLKNDRDIYNLEEEIARIIYKEGDTLMDMTPPPFTN